MHSKDCNITSGGYWCSCDGHKIDPGVMWALHPSIKRVPYLRSVLQRQSGLAELAYTGECCDREEMIDLMMEA